MPRRSCTTCGMPTHSKTGLCADCRSHIKRPVRPELECSGCGRRTTSKKGVCRSCANTSIPCAECGVGRSGEGGLCTGCNAAENDSESPWDLGKGYWRRRRGIREWVPLLVEPKAEVPEDPNVHACVYGGCGIWFVVRRSDQAYCSERCRDAAAYDRRMARERQSQEAA